MIAHIVGEFKIPPSEILEYDIDDLIFWYDRLEDYTKWVNGDGKN